LERLQGICDHVCGSGKSTYPEHAEVIDDPVPFRGPVTGIAAALAYADKHSYDACLVTPVDMPFLMRDDLSKLRERWQQYPTKLCCAVSADDHRIQPLVAIYPVSFRSRLSVLADAKDRSLSRWISAQTHLTIALPAESCRNINFPDDLADH
jgi:molybdopterin-guanine dinucleotide biosynthesis protein A